jgi:hypothetical protein
MRGSVDLLVIFPGVLLFIHHFAVSAFQPCLPILFALPALLTVAPYSLIKPGSFYIRVLTVSCALILKL